MLCVRNSLISLTKNACKLNLIQSCNFSIQKNLLNSDRRYTKKHEWITIKGDIGTVGITDYAQDKLGEVVFSELPAVGMKYAAGDAFCTLESVKAVSECYMPVGGTIQEVNTKISETPSLINKNPFDQGWLIKVNVANKTEADKLLTEAQYREYLKQADDH